MSSGVNVDPLNPAGAPSPDELLCYGIRWVRLVSRPGVEGYAQMCQSAGLMVLATVARESEGHVFGGPDVWQFGNEPDQSGPSSWTMDPQTYADQFGLYQRTYPELTWIGAGLASGDVRWWQAVVTAGGVVGASGMAVHPYDKTAAQAASLLRAYQHITPSLPIWATEWHRPPAEVPAFAAMLRQLTVAHAWFCWTDAMVPGFGLGDTGRVLGAVA